MEFLRHLKDGKPAWALVEGGEAYAISEPGRGATKGASVGKASALKVLAPVDSDKGRKVVALLGNWGSKQDRTGPGFFIKPSSSLINPGDTVVVPKFVTKLFLEPELGVFIGTRAKRVSVADAKKHILGYTVVNDTTAFETTSTVNFPVLWGKAFDTFGMLGPRVVTDIDPTNVTIRAAVNGEEFVNINSGQMMWNAYEVVSWISTVMTLEPGDVICMGAPPGFNGKAIQAGDRMTITLDGIGSLENPVKAED